MDCTGQKTNIKEFPINQSVYWNVLRVLNVAQLSFRVTKLWHEVDDDDLMELKPVTSWHWKVHADGRKQPTKETWSCNSGWSISVVFILIWKVGLIILVLCCHTDGSMDHYISTSSSPKYDGCVPCWCVFFVSASQEASWESPVSPGFDGSGFLPD